MINVNDMSKEQLWKLREEIVLGSLFMGDFENSYDIDPKTVQDFFDAFIEDCILQMTEKGMSADDAWDAFVDSGDWDNAEKLYDYYLSVEYPFGDFEVEKIEEANKTKAQRHNDMMNNIFDNAKKQNRILKDILKDNGVSEEETAELEKATGLHGSALHKKVYDLGLNDEFAKRLGLKEDLTEDHLKLDGDTLDTIKDFINDAFEYMREDEVELSDEVVLYATPTRDRENNQEVTFDVIENDVILDSVVGYPGNTEYCYETITSILREQTGLVKMSEAKEEGEDKATAYSEILNAKIKVNPNRHPADEKMFCGTYFIGTYEDGDLAGHEYVFVLADSEGHRFMNEYLGYPKDENGYVDQPTDVITLNGQDEVYFMVEPEDLFKEKVEESIVMNENAGDPEFELIEDKLLDIPYTSKVEFDYRPFDDVYSNPEEHFIVLVFNNDNFGQGSDYVINSIRWKKNVINTLKELGWKLEDPLEDNGSYLYLVMEKIKPEVKTEGYETLDGNKVEVYSDYETAKSRALMLGLKEAEYGDEFGSDISYCAWNKSGDRNKEVEVLAYYKFENGKPVALTDEEKATVESVKEITFDDITGPIEEKLMLKESSLQKGEHKISDTEVLTWGWEKGYNGGSYYVEKVYLPSPSSDMWSTEFHKTYASEEAAKRAFNRYKRQYSLTEDADGNFGAAYAIFAAAMDDAKGVPSAAKQNIEQLFSNNGIKKSRFDYIIGHWDELVKKYEGEITEGASLTEKQFKAEVPEYIWSAVCSARPSDYAKVEKYLSIDENKNKTYPRFGREHSLIMGAARNNNWKMVKFLISKDLDVLPDEKEEFEYLKDNRVVPIELYEDEYLKYTKKDYDPLDRDPLTWMSADKRERVKQFNDRMVELCKEKGYIGEAEVKAELRKYIKNTDTSETLQSAYVYDFIDNMVDKNGADIPGEDRDNLEDYYLNIVYSDPDFCAHLDNCKLDESWAYSPEEFGLTDEDIRALPTIYGYIAHSDMTDITHIVFSKDRKNLVGIEARFDELLDFAGDSDYEDATRNIIKDLENKGVYIINSEGPFGGREINQYELDDGTLVWVLTDTNEGKDYKVEEVGYDSWRF